MMRTLRIARDFRAEHTLCRQMLGIDADFYRFAVFHGDAHRAGIGDNREGKRRGRIRRRGRSWVNPEKLKKR